MSLGASTPFVVVAVATWGVRAMVECNVTVVMINYKGVAGVLQKRKTREWL